jgi:hypothetical protein
VDCITQVTRGIDGSLFISTEGLGDGKHSHELPPGQSAEGLWKELTSHAILPPSPPPPPMSKPEFETRRDVGLYFAVLSLVGLPILLLVLLGLVFSLYR